MQQNINVDDLRRRIYEAQADGIRSGKHSKCYFNAILNLDQFFLGSGRFLSSLTVVNAILQYAQNIQLNSVDMNNLMANAFDIQLQMANETIKSLDGINVDKLKYLLSATKQIDFSK